MSELILNKSLDYLKSLKLGDAEYNSKIQKLYLQIYESKDLILKIEQFADAYSYDINSPENGFRSIIEIYLIAVKQSLAVCDKPKGIRKYFVWKSQQIK